MRKPDEIKKGLEIYLTTDEETCEKMCRGNKNDCPYKGMPAITGQHCGQIILEDALSLIRQLKAERDFLLKYITDSTWAACNICKHEPNDGSGVMGCKHIREVGVPCFEWRGMPGDAGGEEK